MAGVLLVVPLELNVIGKALLLTAIFMLVGAPKLRKSVLDEQSLPFFTVQVPLLKHTL